MVQVAALLPLQLALAALAAGRSLYLDMVYLVHSRPLMCPLLAVVLAAVILAAVEMLRLLATTALAAVALSYLAAPALRQLAKMVEQPTLHLTAQAAAHSAVDHLRTVLEKQATQFKELSRHQQLKLIRQI